jgi:hypothetical protein
VSPRERVVAYDGDLNRAHPPHAERVARHVAEDAVHHAGRGHTVL